jgi:hypothetical protein
MRSQAAFMALLSCPLSHWERVRVRVLQRWWSLHSRSQTTLTPRPLLRGEGAWLPRLARRGNIL